jgi:hypothetical protein
LIRAEKKVPRPSEEEKGHQGPERLSFENRHLGGRRSVENILQTETTILAIDVGQQPAAVILELQF